MIRTEELAVVLTPVVDLWQCSSALESTLCGIILNDVT